MVTGEVFNDVLLDVDECKHEPSPCGQLCRNDLGEYQCYCKDRFELEADGSTCKSESCMVWCGLLLITYTCIRFHWCMIFCQFPTGKYKECPPLPKLQDGNSSCHSIEGGSVCDLECDADREFTSSVDPTPQICIDGEWSYQAMQVPFPTCEGVSVIT